MPELPDVAQFKSYLDSTSLRRRVTAVRGLDADLVRDMSAARLRKAVAKRRFVSSQRHGKYLLVGLDDGRFLVLHFGMTGFLKASKQGEETPSHARAVFVLDDGYHLAYACQRKLGQLTVVDGPEELAQRHGLGPDALDDALTVDALAERLEGSRAMIKSALMNQQLLAGIGNVYSDEILFHSRMHPKRPAGRLDRKGLRALHRNMRKVLHKAIECRAEIERLPRGYLLPHRDTDDDCPRCGGELDTLKVGGRTAWLCPRCQPS